VTISDGTFLGTHFFNPVRYMKLLEIIPGEAKSPEDLTFMADFGERILGKGIVWAKDTPNFVGNRIGVQGMVKSMQLMLEEGLSIAGGGRPVRAGHGAAQDGHVQNRPIWLVWTPWGMWPKTPMTWSPTTKPGKISSCPSSSKDDRRQMLGKKTQAGFYKTDSDAGMEKDSQGHRSRNADEYEDTESRFALSGRQKSDHCSAEEKADHCLWRR
jgi:3-hydroxyacyl-CoA dehydrogenase